MSERTVVVVFPSIFSLNKINFLKSSISRILKAKKRGFGKIQKNDSVIIVEANDPVFASSAISSLFGIEKIAIATEVENSFDAVVSTIAKVGTNLLLKGERFYVKVEGKTSAYSPKDVELAATSSLIEKMSSLETKPGTEENFDKLLYTYLTKSHAYICIFIDKGGGGIPHKSQNETILCCVYDELSIISCLQTLKMGFDVQILVCYSNETDLLNMVKMINQILPRIAETAVELQFFNLKLRSRNSSSLLLKVAVITEILTHVATTTKIGRISLAVSPLIFPTWFVEYIATHVYQKNLIPWFPLSGIDNSIFETANELGLEKHLSKIENLCRLKFNRNHIPKEKIHKISQMALRTRKSITITIGQKNIHDIIDSLKSNH
ncbi:MAG: thiamine biosynthesis protein [Nitrosopumilaceae archaeon]